ncbi:MAG: hypothetical protein Q8Q63_10345 [Phaeovulum sp.]|uniref:hypothetical protein n=1 Tax=Phaeovulum sp. TaxID=2934796 RepID=UPI00272FCCA0|nr:hypothetical protein [Phaeovulum sp.]MDP2062264.1 hypothetical protein [Phaeovulum sp.]MDP3861968.1 hypothetical protein [Phaeovulum sp.]
MKPVFAKLSIFAAVSALMMVPALPGGIFGAGPAFAKNEKSEAKGNNGADQGGKPERESGVEANTNRNGNAGSNGGGKPEGAAPASELKGLNAYHASAQAAANAAPNSQVGRIETYRTSAGAVLASAETAATATAAADAAAEALALLEAELAALNAGYSGRTSDEIDADIAALDPASPTYAADLAALSGELAEAATQEATVAALAAEVLAAEAEAIALAEAAAAAAAAKAAAEAAEAEALIAAANGRTLSPEALAFLRAQLGLEPALPEPTTY